MQIAFHSLEIFFENMGEVFMPEYTLLLVGLTLSTQLLASDQANPASLEKIIAIQQKKIEKLEGARFAIGSLQQSFISEEKFQEQMGGGWVLCDGRDVTGSKYEKMGFGAKLPNCGGKFLRTLGPGSEALGIPQSHS